MSFIRRFTFDPGDSVLLNIESVNILDLEPPASIQGIGTGTVLLVGEFENGAFNTVIPVSSATDLLKKVGGFGYTYGGIGGNNPSARQRFADAAIVPEFWNGNGFVQLNGKTFAQLLLVRVDTSVGTVQFNPQAFVTSTTAQFSYTLSTGQTLVLDIGGGPVTATFTGVAATVTAIGGTYPTTFTGGQTLTLGYDAAPNFQITFQAADQTVNQVVARINQFAGFTFATVSGGQIKLTGLVAGTSGQVRVVSGSAGVLTQLGLTVATTPGTGNVGNIAQVKPSEVKTIVQAAVVGTLVETDSAGHLRISKVFVSSADSIIVLGGTTALGLGFVPGPPQFASSVPTGVLPAGTLVSNGTTQFVTMQDVQLTAGNPGPYPVKIRHALDDGTGIAVVAGTITTVVNAPDVWSFAVTNLLTATAALTDPQIDAQYVAALPSTLDINTLARQVNIIYSARQSNAIRRALKSNAITASASGLFGRMAVIRTPMNLSETTALSTSVEPGVGAYRDQRVIYCYPQANSFVPAIASVGVSGGTGFNATGNIDIGADGFLASIMSQLPPEENPGQTTSFTSAINSVETGANVQGFTINDYILFKAAGICALRMDNGIAVFQSGVTSVDPSVNPGLKNIARRRMADFIEDSLGLFASGFVKKLSTNRRRAALATAVRQFLLNLLSPNNLEGQRIGGFTVDRKSGNTATQLAEGLYRIIVNVKILPSLDSIVFAVTAGEDVVVVEELPAAA